MPSRVQIELCLGRDAGQGFTGQRGRPGTIVCRGSTTRIPITVHVLHKEKLVVVMRRALLWQLLERTKPPTCRSINLTCIKFNLLCLWCILLCAHFRRWLTYKEQLSRKTIRSSGEAKNFTRCCLHAIVPI